MICPILQVFCGNIKGVATPISREAIDEAISVLYGDTAELPPIAKRTIDDAFADGNYEGAYNKIRESEEQSKDILTDFDKAYPGQLKGENIDIILEQAKRKRQKDDRER